MSSLERPPQNGQKPVEEQKEESSSTLRSLGLLMAILADLLGYTGFFLGATGYLVRNKGWPGWTVFFGGILGLLLAFIQIYRKAKRLLN